MAWWQGETEYTEEAVSRLDGISTHIHQMWTAAVFFSWSQGNIPRFALTITVRHKSLLWCGSLPWTEVWGVILTPFMAITCCSSSAQVRNAKKRGITDSRRSIFWNGGRSFQFLDYVKVNQNRLPKLKFKALVHFIGPTSAIKVHNLITVSMNLHNK